MWKLEGMYWREMEFRLDFLEVVGRINRALFEMNTLLVLLKLSNFNKRRIQMTKDVPRHVEHCPWHFSLRHSKMGVRYFQQLSIVFRTIFMSDWKIKIEWTLNQLYFLKQTSSSWVQLTLKFGEIHANIFAKLQIFRYGVKASNLERGFEMFDCIWHSLFRNFKSKIAS